MERTIYIVIKEDIVHFPPVLSLLNILVDLRFRVVHLGTYSDLEGRRRLLKKGVEFVDMPAYHGSGHVLQKLYDQLKFRSKVTGYLDRKNVKKKDLIWLVQIETIYLLHKLVDRYSVVLHPLEYTDPHINWKYRIISPFIQLKKVFNKAKRIVCCEYNRAHITKGIFDLEYLPHVLPNKPYINSDNPIEIPCDIKQRIEDFDRKTYGKKIILYQGIFLDKERRLEEFCETVSRLPEEYILVAMGSGSLMYDELRKKYESGRILFEPFIKPPFHLEITKRAYIGVLSYFPRPNNIGTVINPLYCAPNKIFEYAKFGKPMLSNDIPGLRYIFQLFHCGECVGYPMTVEEISKKIMEISSGYEQYVAGAFEFYNSVNIKDIVADITKE